MSDYAIEIDHLSLQYPGYQALENLTFNVPVNSWLAIVGPNGAGKSTFLKILLGLIQPSKGTVKIFGKSPDIVPPAWIGYVPQVKTIDRSFPALAIELVMTGISFRWPCRRSKSSSKKALHALKQVGAEHLADHPLGKLSGGELQRIYLARSFVRQPKLIILDEAATGIDEVGRADMYRQLETYQKSQGVTLIMVTHDWQTANHHANLVLLVNQKQISFGSPEQAMQETNLHRAFGHIGHHHLSAKRKDKSNV